MKQKQFLLQLFMAIVMVVVIPSEGWAESVFTYTATRDLSDKFKNTFQSQGDVTCDEWTNATAPVTVTVAGSVTNIPLNAFYSCDGLTSITIPGSVTSIGESAFSACSALSSVSIQDGLTSIGKWAFSCCSSLISVTIPGSVKSVEKGAFYRCSGLTSLTIKDGVERIGEEAFERCSALTSITIPSSVTSIGEYAFNGCSNLISLTVPASVTSIGAGAFNQCCVVKDKLTNSSSLTLTDYGLKIAETEQADGLLIKDNCVVYCRKDATDVTIPGTVTSIGEFAFSGCVGLTSVTIPSGVTSIGEYAFYGCSGLTSVTIPSGVTSINNRTFLNCSGITSITIPSGVTSIGNYAFYGCSNLISLTIPSSVTSIEEDAFNECYVANDNLTNSSSLTLTDYGLKIVDTEQADGLLIKDNSVVYCRKNAKNVTIPSSVTNIEDYSFNGCDNLITLNINSIPNIGYDMKYGVPDSCVCTLTLSDDSYIYVDPDLFNKDMPDFSVNPTYTRTIDAESNWGTVVLPFKAKSDENVQLYMFTSVNKDKMTLEPVDIVDINTPCVFKKKTAGATSITITSSTLSAVARPVKELAYIDGLAMRGTYTKKENVTNVYFIARNKVWKAADAITINPFRAWFVGGISSGAKVIDIVVDEDGESTTIAQLENGTLHMVNDKCFNLQGQRLAAPLKGQINIINGRKVFVR